MNPTFFLNPPELIADIADAIRMRGEEPPDLFEWYFVTCADEFAGALFPILQSLPFVSWAGLRPRAEPAGVVSWGTNPGADGSLQLLPSPRSVGATYAWQVPGGTGQDIRVADIEHGWSLTHEDTVDVHVVRASPQVGADADEIDHGTAVVGIVAARDNGRGIVGVAPRARITAVPEAGNSPAAIDKAVDIVGLGGVVLLELACRWFAGAPGTKHPDIPLEFHPPTLTAIRRNTLFGVTVVEAAGNGGLNLDDLPFAHITTGNSGAIMVGAGVPSQQDPTELRRTFSTFGSRVDCFAPGDFVVAPSSKAAARYQEFNGTSAASAIIAGVAAQIQGMAFAATGEFLHGSDIRRLLRDPTLGAPSTPENAGIKPMPDMKRICIERGWLSAPPPSVLAINSDTIDVAYLDADLLPVRRRWSNFAGWQEIHPNTGDKKEPVYAQPLAMTVGPVQGPFPTPIITDIVANGTDGVHNLWWSTSWSTLGGWNQPRSDRGVFAAGRSVASVRAWAHTLTVVGINPAGQLTMILGNLDRYVSDGFGPPTVIDAATRFLRPGDPIVCSRGSEQLDVLAITDIGLLVWYQGTDTFGAPWSDPVVDQTATEFVPMARPAVVAQPTQLDVIAVGAEGWLYWITIDTDGQTMSDPIVIDTQVTISGDAPVALVRYGERLVALAVDTEASCGSHRKTPTPTGRSCCRWTTTHP